MRSFDWDALMSPLLNVRIVLRKLWSRVVKRMWSDEAIHLRHGFSRTTSRSDPASGAQSAIPEQRRLFPAHYTTPLLRLDWRVCKRH